MVGSVRREMLDLAIPLNERHFRRLGLEYLPTITKAHAHRLGQDTPSRRPLELRLPKRAGFSLDFESVVFITATIGQKQPDSDRTSPRLLTVISALGTNPAKRLG